MKIKKLSTNSPRDFYSGLDTINHYWIDPAKYFCPKTSSLGAIYDSSKSKVVKVIKSNNQYYFFTSVFQTKKLCSLVQKDSFTLKVLKIYFVFFFKVDTKHCKNVGTMFCIEPEKRQSTFLGPLEWRNLFQPSNNVSSYEKLT